MTSHAFDGLSQTDVEAWNVRFKVVEPAVKFFSKCSKSKKFLYCCALLSLAVSIPSKLAKQKGLQACGVLDSMRDLL